LVIVQKRCFATFIASEASVKIKFMLVIRLLRVGKKNQPFFKIVVTDKKNPPRGGRFLETLGSLNPLTKERGFKQERIKYWLSVGAKPSPRVYNLLVDEKIIEGKKINVFKKPKTKFIASEARPPAGGGKFVSGAN